VELCPIDGSGEARRKKSVIVGKGRYAARPDARVARLINANAHILPTWRSVRAMARDFAMHQLDESFLLHAHHVSPFAHSMDAYETQIATREIRSTSVLPHLCRRRERPVAALKRRVPFIGQDSIHIHAHS
jgi:siroheme synthase (precorrin-2 oxidase/ferrochelatase)